MPGMSPRPGLLPGEGRELLIPGRLWPEKGKKKRRDEGEGIRLQQSEFVTKRETSPSLRIRRKRRNLLPEKRIYRGFLLIVKW